jgi:hypothetical protein
MSHMARRCRTLRHHRARPPNRLRAMFQKLPVKNRCAACGRPRNSAHLTASSGHDAIRIIGDNATYEQVSGDQSASRRSQLCRQMATVQNKAPNSCANLRALLVCTKNLTPEVVVMKSAQDGK